MNLKQLREYKLPPIAILDLTGTFLVAIILHTIPGIKRNMSLLTLFILLILLGMLVHWILKIPTALNYSLGIGDKP